jgi:hypothetical protein
MTQELEIHIPISPTEKFFTMVRYFAASLRLNGGKVADSRIVVTIGADRPAENLRERLPWSRNYPIEWRWLDRGLFRAQDYFATAVDRFRGPFQARSVMLVDADTLIVGPLDDLVHEVLQAPAFVGLVAHISPFLLNRELPADEWWSRIFSAAGLPKPDLVCEHTGWGLMDETPQGRFCPPYFNLGMLMAPWPIMARLGKVIYGEMEAVNRVLDSHFRCQIAVPLALARTGAPWRGVPMRYNFPNDVAIASHYRADLADVRVLHYLRVGPFDKSRDFRSVRHLEAFLKRDDLSGINAMLQANLRRVHEQVVRDRPRKFTDDWLRWLLPGRA